jgi:hypothetical protein
LYFSVVFDDRGLKRPGTLEKFRNDFEGSGLLDDPSPCAQKQFFIKTNHIWNDLLQKNRIPTKDRFFSEKSRLTLPLTSFT